jgi:TolB protein
MATGSVPLTGRIAYPAWNADTGQYDIYVSEAGGTGRYLMLTGASQPAFSPDGQWLAVNGERHLQENLLVLPLDGGEPLEVSEHTEDGLPIWSPDGKGLAFSSTQHGDRQSRVYVIDAVPLDGRKEAGRVLRAGTHDVSGAYPTWLSDGQVAYDGCDYSASPAVCGLLKIPTGAGAGAPVAVTTNPADTAPAAHGTKIAFMSTREGNWDIYVVNDDGSGLVRLTQGQANEGLPAWTPDGRTLAYVSDEGGRWAVWAMESDGSNQRQLFEVGAGGLADDWPQQRISWAQ